MNKQGCFDLGVPSRQSHFYKLLEPVITEGFPIHILEAEIDYRKRTIINRGLYIFPPFFSAVYNQERSILLTIYIHSKQENESLNSAVYNHERL